MAIKKYIGILGIAGVLSSHYLVIHLFYLTSLNPYYAITIYTNRFNEFWFEFIFLIISFFAFIYWIYGGGHDNLYKKI